MGSDSAFGEPIFKATPEKEKCVSCGEETEYTIDTHIDMRKYYVEGAGQLCKKCWKRLYN